MKSIKKASPRSYRGLSPAGKVVFMLLDNPEIKIPKNSIVIEKTSGGKIPPGAVYITDNIYVVENTSKEDTRHLTRRC